MNLIKFTLSSQLFAMIFVIMDKFRVDNNYMPSNLVNSEEYNFNYIPISIVRWGSTKRSVISVVFFGKITERNSIYNLLIN